MSNQENTEEIKNRLKKSFLQDAYIASIQICDLIL